MILGQTGPTGNGISNISKTGTSGLVDTYTITYTDGNTTTFTVTNAKSISNIEKTGSAGLIDNYRINYNDGTYFDYVVTNGQDGEVTEEELQDIYSQMSSELEDSTLTGTSIDTTDSAYWKAGLELTGNTYQEVIEAVAGTEVSGTNIEIADYDSTKEHKFTKFSGNTEQVQYIGKNKFNMTNPVSTQNVTISNNSMTQTEADTATNLNMIVREYNSNTATQNYIFNQTITQNGLYQATFTKTSSFNQIRVGHSRNQKNAWALFNINYLTDDTTYTISFNVKNCVQANGMYVIENFQIEQNSEATSYEPFVGRTI